MVNSQVIVPCINVVVPTSSTIIFNPYQIPFDVDGNTDQVISTNVDIVNNSTSPVEVQLAKAPFTTSTTGTDGKKPTLKSSYNYNDGSTSKYIELNLQDMNNLSSKANINDCSDSSYNFGKLETNRTMNLKFTGRMTKKATWTGDENVTIKPVFKIRAVNEEITSY